MGPIRSRWVQAVAAVLQQPIFGPSATVRTCPSSQTPLDGQGA